VSNRSSIHLTHADGRATARVVEAQHRRGRGRASRYGNLMDPWFTYLLVPPDEVTEIVDRTGWRVERLVRDEGPYYVAVLE
jgi:hypothetical protein